jgi:urease accessory protein
MTLDQAQAASAHTFCVSLLGAALRLGAIGHLHAQETLVGLRAPMARLLAEPPPSFEDCYTYTPMVEIAVMRHEVQSARLFAN